jgi:hypothetical protein
MNFLFLIKYYFIKIKNLKLDIVRRLFYVLSIRVFIGGTSRRPACASIAKVSIESLVPLFMLMILNAFCLI